MRTIITILLSCGCAAWLHAAEESLALPDGTTMSYFIEMPVTNSPAPLAIVMGGGKGDRGPAYKALNKLGKPLAERGWVAVSPISPKGQSFYNSAEVKQLIYLINHLLKKSEISLTQKMLVGGLSNGGISAFAMAKRAPQRFSGVIMTPGLPFNIRSDTDLKQLPIYLRIGEDDKLEWADFYDRAVKDLTRAKARVNAKLLQNTGHGFNLNWQALDAWLDNEAK